MTTARKPVQPPQPRQARPLAKQPAQKNPATKDIMQRVRRVIRDSQGQITVPSIAKDTGLSRKDMNEWVGGYRSMPSLDSLVAIIRWLSRHDRHFIREVIKSQSIVSVGSIEL